MLDSPEAIVPLVVSQRRPLAIARFIGHGPADESGPVCSVADRPAAFAALAASGGALGWNALLAERVAAGHGLRGRVLRRESSPVIEVPAGGWEEYLAGRSRNLRSQLGRKRRKLEQENGLCFRLADAGSLDDDLALLFRLHEARWGSGGSGAFRGTRADFHRRFAALALERGWLRLWVAEADDQPVAAWYGFRFAGAESYYQSGRDPAWERSSIGLVLLAWTMQAAMDDGMREYRLLRGGETYKDRFATADPGVETVALGRGALGRAAVAAGAAAARAPASLRRRVVS